MATIINILGSPGIGKSTLATNLFSEMKRADYNVEYVDEFAKHKVYENNAKALDCQPYIFGQQLYKLEILKDSVDYIITDSPLLLSVVYNKKYGGSFNRFALDTFKSYDSINLLLIGKPDIHKNNGRLHNEQESGIIQNNIEQLLWQEGIDFTEVDQFHTPPSELILLIENLKEELANKSKDDWDIEFEDGANYIVDILEE